MSAKPLKLRTDPLKGLPKDALKHLPKHKLRKLEADAKEPTDGGPAFPCMYGCPQGMSLRDYFAGMALTGIAFQTQFLAEASNNLKRSMPKTAATIAYNVADAMLKERGGA